MVGSTKAKGRATWRMVLEGLQLKEKLEKLKTIAITIKYLRIMKIRGSRRPNNVCSKIAPTQQSRV